ncbi:glycosyltransferase family 2 protein [Gloeobacter kilaueensis]|uniref:Glycosyl transferase family 2 n=1 Tax=Gloeobacter kilaueensis (strain ATCC BAA-2537 / CCAP 1431/1 / ULC 316 / JS1) TaxID=1183438 RepID=U5QL46_GLOK1|nr:glycosyltransferase family 2 protein [Gloeobacter kilaueensis]AGY59717.1 glycosyl transferase family 2 [Gloeobacter kilaueensis JS1]
MAELPRISVIVPSFNQGTFIERTLLSILGQGYPDLEVIVIDGGSTDETINVLERYSDQLTCWHSQPDRGQADAINRGMAISSGQILCWLNSDDMFLPGTLLAVGSHLRDQTERPKLLHGGAVTIAEENGELRSGVQSSQPFDCTRLTCSNFIVQPSSFWTRPLWQGTGELNIRYQYILDWDWFLRASRVPGFEADYLPRFLSLYRYHAQHKTSSGGEKRRQEIMELIRTHASPYWQNLYSAIDRSYPQIQHTATRLEKLGLPGRTRLLPWLIPNVRSHLKSAQDFYTVLFTFGW